MRIAERLRDEMQRRRFRRAEARARKRLGLPPRGVTFELTRDGTRITYDGGCFPGNTPPARRASWRGRFRRLGRRLGVYPTIAERIRAYREDIEG